MGKKNTKPKNQPKSKSSQSIERGNPLQSGLFFWLSDCQRFGDSLKILEPLLKKFSLGFSVASGAYGRNAFYLNLPETSEYFTAQSLYPELRRASHITIDCEYYRQYSPINDRLKWHYCHYTEEYYSPQKELLFIVHQYFNKLGNQVLVTITNNLTGDTTDLSAQQYKQIYLNLEHSKEIISNLIAAKDKVATEAVNKANLECEKLAASAVNACSAKDALDADLIEENLISFQEAVKLARRYADDFLQFPEKYIAEILAKLNQSDDGKTNLDSGQVDDDKSEQIVIDAMAAASIDKNQKTDVLSAIAFKYSEISNHFASLGKQKDAYISPAQLDDIKFAAGDMLQDLLTIAPDKNNNKKYSKLIKDISNLIKSIAKIEQPVQDKLTSEPKELLQFLQKNFQAIEKDIPPGFYLDLLNKAINSSESDKQHYIDICEFLSQNSSIYLALLKPPYDSITTDSVFGIMLRSYLVNNPEMFEVLLKHGVKLGADVFTEEKDVGVSLFKVLFNAFNECLKSGASDDQKEKDFIKFLNIMLDPRFKAGLEYVYNIYDSLSKGALEYKIKDALKKKKTVERNKNTYQMVRDEENSSKRIGVSSVLELAIKIKAPAEIIKVLADHIKPDEISLATLAKGFGNYVTDNSFEIVVNDDKNTEKKISCPKLVAQSECQKHCKNRDIAVANGTVNPHLYLFPGINPNKDKDQDIHEALQGLTKLLESKLSITNYADFKKDIENLLGRNPSLGVYMGAILLLIINIEADRNWVCLKLFDAFLQFGNLKLQDKRINEDHKYIYFFHAQKLFQEINTIPDSRDKQKLLDSLKSHADFSKMEEYAGVYRRISGLDYRSRAPKPS